MESRVGEGWLEVSQSGLEFMEPIWTHSPTGDSAFDNTYGDKYRHTRRTICGLLLVTFFLAFALLVVTILAGVGGGVGVPLGVSNAKSEQELDVLPRNEVWY